jgi:hypothetical protein
MIFLEKIHIILLHQENPDVLPEVYGKDLFYFYNIFVLNQGLTYCTLNKIHRNDLLHVLQLYPEFTESFIERFRVTFDLRQVKI